MKGLKTAINVFTYVSLILFIVTINLAVPDVKVRTALTIGLTSLGLSRILEQVTDK